MQQTGLNPRATLVMKKRPIYDTFPDVRSYDLHRLSIMTLSKTRIGLVGFGRIAELAYMPIIQSSFPDMHISAVYDTDSERLQRVTRDYPSITTFNRYEDFLDTDIRAVLICTPNWSHCSYSQRALEAGKHVLCEKPLALRAADARNVVNAARQHGRFFMVSSPNRFRSDIVQLRCLIASPEFGDISAIRCGWLRRSGIPNLGSWFTTKRLSGGGSLTDLGSHLIDIALYLAGDHRLENVSAELCYSHHGPVAESNWYTPASPSGDNLCDVEISAKCQAVAGERIALTIETSWHAPVEHDTTFIDIQGTSGAASFRSLFGMSPNGTRPAVSGYARYDNGRVVDIAGSTCIMEPFKLQLQEFFRGVNANRRPPDSTLERYVASAEFLESAYQHTIENYREPSFPREAIV